MAIKKFTDFDNKPSLEDADYMVGYKADGTAEYRTTLSSLVEYLKYYFTETVDTTPTGSIILSGYSVDPTFYSVEYSTPVEFYRHKRNLYADAAINLTSLFFNNECEGYLDLSPCQNIQRIFCNGTAIKQLNTSGCVNLSSIQCEGNALSSLDITSPSAVIENLICNDNQISSLDVSSANNLKTLKCENNNIESLDFSNCTVLEDIWCSSNPIKDLKYNSESLLSLYTDHCSLTSLDIKDCGMLGVLWCQYNSLSSLDLSGTTGIYQLSIANNELETIDIGYQHDLVDFYCDNNKLNTAFNLMNIGQGQPSLRYIRAYNNQFDENAVNAILVSMNLYRPDPVTQGYGNEHCILLGSDNPSETNAAPTGAGLIAKNELIAKGWIVSTS